MSGCTNRVWSLPIRLQRDPHRERERLVEAVEELRVGVDKMLEISQGGDKEQLQVLEAYRMFANSKGWMRRMEEDIALGLSAEAAVEKEQSQARARMGQVTDPYLRERLADLDDLSNRLLRILTGQGTTNGADLPPDPILVARNIGPGDLLEYGRSLKGIVLEEGSVGSHATIVARALAIPLVVHVGRITTEALNSDHILVDGGQTVSCICGPRTQLSVHSATRLRCRPRRKSVMPRSEKHRP